MFFLTVRHFFAKCTFLKLQQVFSLSTYLGNSILSTVVRMIGCDSVSSPLATIAKETSPFNTNMQLINPNNPLS